MEDQLRLVYRYLDADLSDNALFLASVLHALDPENGTWAHLKSLACLRLGQYGLARQYSCENGLTGEHLGCSYVFALASLSQGNYLEGISALERAKPHWQLRNRDASAPLAPDPLTQRFWPDRPAVNCLLAKLHRYNKDNKNAAIHFTEALESDPLMWDALTNLCDIGTSPVSFPGNTSCLLTMMSSRSYLKYTEYLQCRALPPRTYLETRPSRFEIDGG
jgi:anaphase-promoting complex subunit 3